MANLTITATNVQLNADSIPSFGIAGETLAPGQTVYLKSSDRRWWKARAGSTVDLAESLAIVVTNATEGSQVCLCGAGSLAVGTILTLNTAYVLSATSGLICPIGDLVAGNWTTIIGIPRSTSILKLMMTPQRFQVPA
jgi:hypothetical protein